MATTKAAFEISATDRASKVIANVKHELLALSGIGSRLTATLGPLGLLATAAGALGGAVYGIKTFVGGIDDLIESAEGLGVTAVALSEMRSKAAESGVDTERLSQALSKLNSKIGDAATGNKQAAATFTAMGIAVRDANGNVRGTESVLADVADKFASYANTAEKGALASELFGERIGRRLVAYLSQGSGALRQFSGVTEETVRDAERLQREIDKLNNSYERLKNTIGGLLAAGINRIFGAFGEETANSPTAQLDRLRAGIDRLKAELARETRPEFISALTTQITQAEQRAASLAKSIGTIKQQLLGNAGYGEGGTRAPLVEKEQKAGASDAQKFLDSLREQALFAGKTADEVLRIKAEMFGVAGAAEPFLRTIESVHNATKDMAYLTELLSARQRERDEADQKAARAHLDRLKDVNAALTALQSPADRAASALARIEEWKSSGALAIEAARRGISELDAEMILVNAAFDEMLPKIEKAEDIAADLAIAFRSAFEDAVIGGKKFSDVLRGLEMDIVRLVLRMTVTKPLEGFLSKSFSSAGVGGDWTGAIGSFFTSIFGGPKAAGGPVGAGVPYMVGERGPELFVPRQSGQIIDAQSTRRLGRPMTINVNVPAATSGATAQQIAATVARTLAIADARLN